MIQLRDYQQDLIQKARQAVSDGVRRLIIQAPTGAGKTAMIANMLQGVSAKKNRAWFIVHRRELIEQSAETFDKVGLLYGIIAANFPQNLKHFIQIASVQSLARRLKTVGTHPSHHPQVLIWDECHHITAGTWSKIMEAQKQAIHIGLTATPHRLDGSGLDKHFDHLLLGPTIRELIDKGWLSDYKAYAPTHINLKGLHTRMGDYVRSELEHAMDKPTITGSAIREYKRHANHKPAIVFAASVKHSQKITEEFKQSGLSAYHLDGKTDLKTRKQTIKDFRQGHLKILSNVDLFSEGFDVPGVHCAILMRPTQSLSLYLQQIGRALRPAPGKTHAIILDHANNIQTHGMPCMHRQWSLEGRTKQNRNKITDTSLSVHICEKCCAALPSHQLKCPYCGNLRPIQHRKVEFEEGELEEIEKTQQFRKRMKEQAEAADFNSLVQLGKQRGYKSPYGWAKHIWRARQSAKNK